MVKEYIGYSENYRYLLSDLTTFYDIVSAANKAFCFLNDHTKLTLKNDELHLFINLENGSLTMGLPVIGPPKFSNFEEDSDFYLEDYEQFKILRAELCSFQLMDDPVLKINNEISRLESQFFEGKESLPKIVRVIFPQWQEEVKISGEFTLLVDFFLD